MSIPTEATGVMSELIELNRDRIAGFEKAINETDDSSDDLKELFGSLIASSRTNCDELLTFTGDQDVSYNADVYLENKVRRVWMDIQTIFTGKDLLGILTEAENGEESIKEVYVKILAGNDLTKDVVPVVERQLQEIKRAYSEISTLRAMAASSSS